MELQSPCMLKSLGLYEQTKLFFNIHAFIHYILLWRWYHSSSQCNMDTVYPPLKAGTTSQFNWVPYGRTDCHTLLPWVYGLLPSLCMWVPCVVLAHECVCVQVHVLHAHTQRPEENISSSPLIRPHVFLRQTHSLNLELTFLV